MPESNSSPDHEKLEAPEGLRKAMGGSQKERVLVPPEVDDAILSRACAHLAKVRERQSRRWMLPKWAAVAAALVLGIGLLWLNPFSRNGRQTFAAGDINRDGKVDILDAFMLAKKVETGASTPAWDVNGDHKVDRQDAEAIAKSAVKLQKGKQS